jgi:hypothetical protein
MIVYGVKWTFCDPLKYQRVFNDSMEWDVRP